MMVGTCLASNLATGVTRGGAFEAQSMATSHTRLLRTGVTGGRALRMQACAISHIQSAGATQAGQG
jgi:hypothetical protein